MRLNVASLHRMVKGKLHVEFARQELTSYSGLELFRRYLRQGDLPRRLRPVVDQLEAIIASHRPLH